MSRSEQSAQNYLRFYIQSFPFSPVFGFRSNIAENNAFFVEKAKLYEELLTLHFFNLVQVIS